MEDKNLDKKKIKVEISNSYLLYFNFINVLIKRELNLRGKPESVSSKDAFLELSKMAFFFYSNPACEDFAELNLKIKFISKIPIVKTKMVDKMNYITGFSHETFKEFLVAYYYIANTLDLSCNTITALQVGYKHQVSKFVRERFSILDNSDLFKILNNMKILLSFFRPYYKSLKKMLSLELKRSISSLNKREELILKNEIIYFVPRLPLEEASLNEFIANAYHFEREPILKRSAAIGATILGNELIELSYAKQLLNDADENLLDRSFTLVYYEDVREDIFTYQDDGIVSWENSRRARIKRLQETKMKSERLRTFDLITLYNFTLSRNYGRLFTEDEINAIKSCNIDISFYSEEKKHLLQDIKQKFLDLISP